MALNDDDMLAATRQMVTALTTNEAQVAVRGIPPEFVVQGQGAVERLQMLKSEHERLKVELETALLALHNWHILAIGAVRYAYRGQPEKWIEFGISDRQ